MNPIRQWLDRRAARQQDEIARQLAESADLEARLEALVTRFRDRLDPKAYAFILEQPGYAESELAIDMLWEKVDGGALMVSPSERHELIELTRHPGITQGALSATARRHIPSRDMRQR